MKGRRLSVAGLLVGVSVSALMQTFISATAADIALSLGNAKLYSWIFGAYALASTVSMPLFGKAGQTMPARGLYAFGALLFGAGTLASGLAPGMGPLIAARALAGVGAGAVVPSAYALAGRLYGEADTGKIFSMIGAAQIAANVAGPLAGGLAAGPLWRMGFFVSSALAVGAAVLVLAGSADPATAVQAEARRPGLGGMDLVGAVLVCAALVALVLGLQSIRDGSVLIGSAVSASAILVSALAVAWERRQADPILPIRLFKEKGPNLATALAIGAVTNSALAFVPLVMGGTGSKRSFGLLPMMVAAGVGSVLSGIVPMKARKPAATAAWSSSILSFALLAASALGRTSLSPAIGSVPAGFGMGFLWPALLGRSRSGAASSEMAMLGSALQLSRNLGGSAAVSLLGVVAVAGSAGAAGNGGGDAGLASVFAFLTLAAAAGLCAGLSIDRTPGGKHERALVG
jgi:MFS family permease